MINGHTNTQYWNKAHPENVQVKLFSQVPPVSCSSQLNSHKCHRHRSQSKSSFRSTHRKQYHNHNMYTAMSWNAFVFHWISYPDLMPMDVVLHFLHFQSFNLCGHTGATAPPNENVGNYTHTITQAENINIKFMYDMYDLLIQNCVEKHMKCVPCTLKWVSNTLNMLWDQKVKKEIKNIYCQLLEKAINSFFFVLNLFNGCLRAERFGGHLLGNCFWGSNYISNYTQIRKNEKSLLFKEEQEDRMTLRKL